MESKKKAPAKEGNPVFQYFDQYKDKDFQNQYQTVYQAFYGTSKTMLQVSIETGILRANICRYVAEMLDKDQIQVIRYGLCPFTHFRAGFYSSDPTLFSKSINQPTLFDESI